MKGWIKVHVLFKTEEQQRDEDLGLKIDKDDAEWIVNNVQISNIGAFWTNSDGETVMDGVIVRETEKQLLEMIKHDTQL